MNKKVLSFGSEDQTHSKSLPFSSPVSIIGIAIVILGYWHATASFAQYPYSTSQPAISYATYAPNVISSHSSEISTHSIVRNWALDVANAQMNLDPNRLPDIGITRQRLDRSMAELENFLATSPQHQANWLAFLTWNDIRAELKKEKADPDHISQFEKTFRQNYVGLELRQFTNVRDALTTFSHALKFSSDRPKAIESSFAWGRPEI